MIIESIQISDYFHRRCIFCHSLFDDHHWNCLLCEKDNNLDLCLVYYPFNQLTHKTVINFKYSNESVFFLYGFTQNPDSALKISYLSFTHLKNNFSNRRYYDYLFTPKEFREQCDRILCLM